MFDKGVLKSYYVDNYYGRKLALAPTSGSMSNLSWQLGSKSQQQLLADVKDGLFITGFIGGNSNGGTGDFSLGFVGFRIRDGAIAEPVSEMNLADNNLEFWKKLKAVGNDPFAYSSQLHTVARIRGRVGRRRLTPTLVGSGNGDSPRFRRQPIETGLLPFRFRPQPKARLQPSCLPVAERRNPNCAIYSTLRSKWGLSRFPALFTRGGCRNQRLAKRGTVPLFHAQRRPDGFHGLPQCTYVVCDALPREADRAFERRPRARVRNDADDINGTIDSRSERLTQLRLRDRETYESQHARFLR